MWGSRPGRAGVLRLGGGAEGCRRRNGAAAPMGQGQHMNDLDDLQSRLGAALVRIRTAAERLKPADEGEETVAELKARLDEERTANAQLEERVKALKDRQDTRIAELEGQVAASDGRLAALDQDLQALQQANAELRAVAEEMHKALAEGVAEPELVNRAVLAELEALRAARSADRAEMDAILSELQPILKEAT